MLSLYQKLGMVMDAFVGQFFAHPIQKFELKMQISFFLIKNFIYEGLKFSSWMRPLPSPSIIGE